MSSQSISGIFCKLKSPTSAYPAAAIHSPNEMGKRGVKKTGRAQGEDAEGAEIFVRNLSYDTTGEDLEEFFGKVGPVKRANIVNER